MATDSSGAALGADPNLTPGSSVTLQAAGFTAAETVGVTLHSTPETLPSVTADSTGKVTYQFTVPSDLEAGGHTVVFVGATSGANDTWAFTVPGALVADPEPAAAASGGSLPFTGANSSRLLVLAIAALWGGLILMLVARPRTALVVAGSAGHRHAIAKVQQPGRHRGGRHRR